MCSFVFRVVFLREEIFGTELALVRFDLEVDSFSVVDESRVGLEPRSAFWTEVRLDIVVDGIFVDFQG